MLLVVVFPLRFRRSVVDLAVGAGEECLDELAVVYASAAVVIKGLEELYHAPLCEAYAHLPHHLEELCQVQGAVLVHVEPLEKCRDVVGLVAPLNKAFLRAAHQQHSVALAPDLREGLADDAQGHRHVEHAGDHQDSHYQGAGGTLGRLVAVADGGHRHNGEPHGLWQRVNVIARLHQEDERREDQRQHEQGEEADRQGFKAELEGGDQEPKSLEASDGLHEAEHRHKAQEQVALDVLQDAALTIWDLKVHCGTEEERRDRQEIHQVVPIEEECYSAGAGDEAQQQLQGEQSLYHDVEGGCRPLLEDGRLHGLQNANPHGDQYEDRREEGIPAGCFA
mmetsp:Transcript_40698/g.113071  ORF Transcript_40698/g.113071 Transcript_40698/m.113071 type:complete len:337 (+) Transcript_40698:184-1194(+)